MGWWPAALGGVGQRLGNWKQHWAILLLGAAVASSTGLTFCYLQGRGWVDAVGRPVRKPVEPIVSYLKQQSDFRYFYADYWDAYRLAFLSDGRVWGWTAA